MAHVEQTVAPSEFMNALLTLRSSNVRPEIALEEIPAPRGIAPYSVALEGQLADSALTLAAANLPRNPTIGDHDDVVTGKFILLYDPAGQESWGGNFRVVVLVRATIDQDIAGDPLLTEVAWSWLHEAFDFCGVAHDRLAGTITRTISETLGDVSPVEQVAEIEIRASWTPEVADPSHGINLDFGPHLSAWTNLMSAAIGLPVVGQGFPARHGLRGPQSIIHGT